MKKIFYMGKEYAGFTDNAMDMTNPKIDLASYGTSPTSGGTVTKVVTTNGGNFKRVNGAYVVVTFANANTGSVSLNVDGTGSKYAYYNGSRLNASNGNFSAGETVTFMYDGTYYQRLDTDTDDTSILKSLANLGWSDVLSSGMLIVKKLLAKMLSVPMVVEEGVNGTWKYQKWSNGRYHAWYEGTINLLAGTSWLNGGAYHAQSSGNPPPSFSKSVTSLTGSSNGQVLMAYVGHNTSSFVTYWLNGTLSASNGLSVRLDMYGTWK